MKLYHLTKDLNHNGVFTPRIPYVRACEEDFEIPRICFSTSIEGALSAIPCPRGALFEDLNQSFGFVWRVFEIDTDNLPEGNYILSKELYESGKILDAWLTGEVWVTQPLDLANSSYLVMIPNFDKIDLYSDTWKAEIEKLGWTPHPSDDFSGDMYQKSIRLNPENGALTPDSFNLGPQTVQLVFNYTEEVENMELKAFCQRTPDLSYLEQVESRFKSQNLIIETNEALQRLCDYLGNHWRSWEPLEDLY